MGDDTIYMELEESRGSLYVLDGPDCVGKSTLARALATRCGAMYVNLSGDKALWPVMWEYHHATWDVVTDNLNRGHHVVMDRFWMSEVIYHDVIRPDLERFYNAPMFEALVRGFQGLNILCYPDDESVQRHRMHRDPGHPYEDLIYKRICEEYVHLFEAFTEGGRDDVWKYSMGFYNNNVDKAIDDIIAYDERR